MKTVIVVITAFLLLTSSKPRDGEEAISFDNASSIRQLPSVIRDLSIALNESPFFRKLLPAKGITIHVHDVTCKTVDISAALQKQAGDSVYYVKLNGFNKRAADNALAATLIHETMHCILTNLVNRTRTTDSTVQATILNFGLKVYDSSNFFSNEFFVLMNEPGGQHELMSRLLYPQMVLLLKRFSKIHGERAKFDTEPAYMMWSGLQGTNAFQNLGDEEKNKIAETILNGKRINR